jgi:hypothetical protein
MIFLKTRTSKPEFKKHLTASAGVQTIGSFITLKEVLIITGQPVS